MKQKYIFCKNIIIFLMIIMLSACSAGQEHWFTPQVSPKEYWENITPKWFDILLEKSKTKIKEFSDARKQNKNIQIVNKNDSSKRRIRSDEILVQKDDTYYLLAKEHNVSLEDLIERNNSNPPYKLVKGQVLYLPKTKIHKVIKGDTLYKISRQYKIPVDRIASMNSLKAPYILSSGQDLIVTEQKLNTDTKIKFDAPKRRGKFILPVKGKIIAQYGVKKGGVYNDGVNISVPYGTKIKVAENGVVLYTGTELEGYGKLMLVKHSNKYITVYAHLSKFIKKVGQKVTQGEYIAISGKSGNVRNPQLHFEIRRGRKSIDPRKVI